MIPYGVILGQRVRTLPRPHTSDVILNVFSHNNIKRWISSLRNQKRHKWPGRDSRTQHHQKVVGKQLERDTKATETEAFTLSKLFELKHLCTAATASSPLLINAEASHCNMREVSWIRLKQRAVSHAARWPVTLFTEIPFCSAQNGLQWGHKWRLWKASSSFLLRSEASVHTASVEQPPLCDSSPTLILSAAAGPIDASESMGFCE